MGAPQMPMENLRKIRGDCKALAKQFGLPYREVSFIEAIKLMLGGLYQTGREELASASRTSMLRALSLSISSLSKGRCDVGMCGHQQGLYWKGTVHNKHGLFFWSSRR